MCSARWVGATSKFSTINNLPIRDLNWTGRLIQPDGSSTEINLFAEFPSLETKQLRAKIDNNGMLSGKVRIAKSEFLAQYFRQNYANTDQLVYAEQLQSQMHNAQIADYKIENKTTDFDKPVVETFNFNSNNELEIIANKMYFFPLTIFANKSNPFTQNSRYCHIDFEYLKEENYNFNIELPDGYDVETLPKSINITSDENIFNFKYLIEKNDNKIQLVVNFNYTKSLLTAEYFEIIKNFYAQMINKINEKIVLVKK